MDTKLNQRRTRLHPIVRGLTSEFQLRHEKFIQPLFVVEDLREKEPVPGLTGVYRETETTLLKQVEADLEKGTQSFLLFGVPRNKAKEHFDPSFVARQISAIKSRFGRDLFLSVDVCLCSSTVHGHCGVLNEEGSHVVNDVTVQKLSEQALAYAEAGADCVAPSDMMDGRVGAIRETLDAAQKDQTLIMSYAAKFQSTFYGPFRIAADSSPQGSQLKDRKTYQISPYRPSAAMNAARRDEKEGADILMVKPGLPYLDILSQLSKEITKPWAVYEVSGEYAAIECAAKEGLMDAPKAHLESWAAFIRAGAEMVISYGARNAREWINQNEY